jgi:hypothetical protein
MRFYIVLVAVFLVFQAGIKHSDAYTPQLTERQTLIQNLLAEIARL